MKRKKPIESAVERIVAYYRNNGFGRTAIFAYKRLGKELLEDLVRNGLQGSEADITDWLNKKLALNKDSYQTLIMYNRFAHLLLEEMGLNGCTYANVGFLRIATSPSTPVWQRVLDSYQYELKKEAKAESTICFSRRACTKFIIYLEQQGCFSPAELSKDLVLRYQSEAGGHITANGKRAYLYRIRMFIRHLQRQDLVNQTLEFVINTHYRIPQKVVTILSEEQKLQVRSHRKSDNPYSNRSYAMATLALYLGLRSSDIITLKFEQISWIQNTVTVVQQKTKGTQILPLIPVVGNAISDYVLHHRPKSGSLYLFISHKAPFGKLTRGACYSGTTSILGNKRLEREHQGLHIMRRTFATSLLQSNVKHEMVSSFLGHSDLESISPYLVLDRQRMGCCALNLELVGKPEVLG